MTFWMTFVMTFESELSRPLPNPEAEGHPNPHPNVGLHNNQEIIRVNQALNSLLRQLNFTDYTF